MSWERPSWYMTTQEFADLVVESLAQTNHFRRGERAHPEDIVIAFTTQAEAIALGAGAAGKKIHEAKNKKAIMETKDLRKHALPQDDEIAPQTASQEEFLGGYSDWKYKKNANL